MEAKRVALLLRIGLAFEFAGHGWLALHTNPSWIPFITYFGFSVHSAEAIMPRVGILDETLAALALVRPMRGLLMWMGFWALFTALLRPLTGLPVVALVERAANVAVPLALLALYGLPRTFSELWSHVEPASGRSARNQKASQTRL